MVQRVLIQGSSGGGFGHFAVQFAHACGATGFATACGDGVALVASLGADHVIDYKRQSLAEFCNDMDVVLDLVGGKTRDDSFASLRRNGILVSTLDEPNQDVARSYGVRAMRFTTERNRRHLTQIAGSSMMAKRDRLLLQNVHFRNISAIENMEKHHPKGKVVLRVDA